MRDRGRIVAGLGAFLAVAAFPLWHALASRAPVAPPVLARATEGPCLEDTAWMRVHHEALLNQWRTDAVRDGRRGWVASSGRRYEISLTGTCLACHAGSAAFCDRCHAYSGVPTIRCWSCHVQPDSVPAVAAARPPTPSGRRPAMVTGKTPAGAGGS